MGYEDDDVLSFISEDGMQSFEGWFQDLQLSVNECFENPESRTDVEILLQRLAVSQSTPHAHCWGALTMVFLRVCASSARPSWSPGMPRGAWSSWRSSCSEAASRFLLSSSRTSATGWESSRRKWTRSKATASAGRRQWSRLSTTSTSKISRLVWSNCDLSEKLATNLCFNLTGFCFKACKSNTTASVTGCRAKRSNQQSQGGARFFSRTSTMRGELVWLVGSDLKPMQPGSPPPPPVF